MSYISKLVIFSFIVLALSIILHDYMPSYIIQLGKYPFINSITFYIHKFIKNPFYFVKDNINKKSSIKKSIKEKIFLIEELKDYDGKEGSKGLYLALLGRVYDVHKGNQYYGPGGGYEFFSGRDGTRAFVSGDFTEAGLIDDISGLTNQDYLGLDDWSKFYEKDYKLVGKLVGRFYDSYGKPTEEHHRWQKWLAVARGERDANDREKVLFPPCNSEWTPENGSTVYCTTKSGGISRDWVGVPRRLLKPGKGERCACVRATGAPSDDFAIEAGRDDGDLSHPNLKPYDDCESKAQSCSIPK